MILSIKHYGPKTFRFISLLYLGILLFITTTLNAQSSNENTNRILIDGVSAVIGDYVILNSDIDKTMIELESQGMLPAGMSKCNLLSNLMENRLYQHHAVQDSIEVSDSEIYSMVDQNLENFVMQLGSMEKVLEFYDKSDELSFRQEIFEINKAQILSQRMKAKIIENVEVTPEEVRLFFESIPQEELPVFGTELEISQIVIEPEVSQLEERRVINLLRSFKEDVLEKGMSFASKAILYSQDPASRSSGGKYTLHRKRPRMVKEFRDVAFSLREGEISEPFKTEFGWHIITVDKVRGQEIDIRHILIIPKVEVSELSEARAKIDTIRTRIIDGEIPFAGAAFRYSDERETKFNNGVLINPATGDSRFELTNLDPTLYKQIEGLADGEISLPLLIESPSGQKSYKIIQVSNRFDAHVADFTQDYVRIKDLALKDKQFKVIKEWIEEKIDDTYIYIHKDKQYCHFERNWMKEI
ncbi:MAG: peptidylprolyl isomerase [Flavobacteriaceae bacterium]|nr:peptidylprolyl isomerase [Flavobacteriaceae bacterium]MCY4217647.1 peptidylprolyl isomerase [Flavobacteriaceae bacterium]MCY4253908.1 peptidylprolyl isomerase [Flavobacteriaceae bacterium]